MKFLCHSFSTLLLVFAALGETLPAQSLAAANLRNVPAERAVPFSEVRRPNETPSPRQGKGGDSRLDLNPSFKHRLPYSQVCGVIVCQSDVPLSEMETILGEMTQLQDDLKKYLAIPEANEKIELCIFSNEKTYGSFLKKEFPDAPTDRRALYVKIKGPGIVLVQKSKDFEIDLRHEMTHAILHASIREVPIWLDEGLAKYFEPRPDERAFENPYLSKIRRNSRFGLVPSLDRLEKLTDISEMGNREYQESWAWVHFLMHDSPETHQMLARYLRTLAENPNPLPKIASRLRGSLGNPRTEFQRHYKQWSRNEDMAKRF